MTWAKVAAACALSALLGALEVLGGLGAAGRERRGAAVMLDNALDP